MHYEKSVIYIFHNKIKTLMFFTLLLVLIVSGFVYAQGTVTITKKLGPFPAGGSADDPAIWIHPTDSSKSLMFLSDKSTGIYVRDFSGKQCQHINFNTALNNIDTRTGFNLGGQQIDIVAANLRDIGKLAVFKINPNHNCNNDVLTVLAGPSSTGNSIQGDSYGFTLYKRLSDGKIYVFEKPKSSTPIKQYFVDGSSGSIMVTAVRTINDVAIGVAEGAVADDELGLVYFAEEAKGIHKYNADPDSSVKTRLSFFASGDGTASDREGLSMYKCNDGTGYLILSSQGNSQFKVYERQGSNVFKKTFLASGSSATDGQDSTSSTAPGFPNGFLVIHDGGNNYNVFDWADVAQSDLKICPNGGLGTITAQCSDGIDNDGDGKIDYPADPGCTSTSDNSEIDVDTTLPTVSVTHSPASITTSTSVTVTATASDNVGVTNIEIFVDGLSKKICTSSPCSYGPLVYSTGTHTYYATVKDAANNSGRDPASGTKSFTVSGTDTTPPVRSSGSPSGTLPSGTTSSTISLTTNEAATCRYSTTANIAYSSMTNTFTTTGGTSHSRSITGLANGSTYSYYIMCIDSMGNVNTDDFTISFSVAIGSVTLECQSLSGFASSCINNIPVLKLSNLSISSNMITLNVSANLSQGANNAIYKTGYYWNQGQNQWIPFALTGTSYPGTNGSTWLTNSASKTLSMPTSAAINNMIYVATWDYVYQNNAWIGPSCSNAAGCWRLANITAQNPGTDTTPPTVSVTHSPASITSSTAVNITATASDANGVANIAIFVDGAEQKITCPAPGTAVCLATNCPLTCSYSSAFSSGTHTYYATAKDSANNTGRDPASGTKSFTVSGTDTTPPVRSSGSPSGTLPSGTTSSTISLTTNEAATCKYSTTANIAYSSMTNTFTTTGGTSHSRSITGLANGNTYSYYIRCIDTANNTNTEDFTISFSVASSGGGTGTRTLATPPNFKIALIGDGYAVTVFQMIKDKNPDMIIHSGDFDYTDNPTAFDSRITQYFGANYPYFGSVGNHDVAAWPGYQTNLKRRIPTDATCTGNYGVDGTCTYKGLTFILSGAGTMTTSGVDHTQYLKQSLAQSQSIWNICSWHKQQREMTRGTKGSTTGWEVYEACREGGALVVNGHEHQYARTKSLISFPNLIINPFWPEPFNLAVYPGTGNVGSSFTALSGSAGRSLDAITRCTGSNVNASDCKNIWAAGYGDSYGALFITFNVNGNPRKAHGEFYNVAGDLIDSFDITVP